MYDEDWSKLLKKLAEDEEITHLKKILLKLPNIDAGDRSESWRRFFSENDRQALKELLEKLVKAGEYSSQIFPAIVGKSSAPNFWLKGERSGPDLKEAEKALYLLLSSACFGNTLINLDNIKDAGRNEWRRFLITEAGENQARIMRDLGVRSRSLGPFYLSLLTICYWLYQLKLKGIKGEEDLHQIMTDWGIGEDTAIVIFEMGRKKKEVHYFSRLSSFILKWFKGYFDVDEIAPPTLITFLDSLSRVSSDKNVDLVGEAREKLVFYLLKYHEMNGEVLSKLVQLKVQDAITSKKVSGVVRASEFFAGLVR